MVLWTFGLGCREKKPLQEEFSGVCVCVLGTEERSGYLVSILERSLFLCPLLGRKGYRELWADGGGHSSVPGQPWWQSGLYE